MSIRAVQFVDGECYHLYNRGNSKQEVFHDQHDYLYFINLLSNLNTEQRVAIRELKDSQNKGEMIVSIGAYCLMPNHFHILVKQEREGGISKFMQKVSTAYVMYYNKKYKHTGGLFEGKFKSKYAGEDIYLKYLFSYIHLNPLKLMDSNWKSSSKYLSEEKLNFLVAYKYSSFGEYYTNAFTLINKEAFPDHFNDREGFIKDIQSWFSLIP